MSQPIQPLRISKGTPSSSPNKMAGTAQQYPLAEVSPMERRRNSPSFDQRTKQPLLNSSPFDSSPFASKFNLTKFGADSPHAYWQSRDPGSPTRSNAENRDPRDDSPAPAKRSSIENLKRASRVKNSSMFAREQKHEYDPTSVPLVERPLAAGRPLTSNIRHSEAHALDTEDAKQATSPMKLSGHGLVDDPQNSPARAQHSPGKSSLSKSSRYGASFGPDAFFSTEDDKEIFNERKLPAGKSLRRHAKSVTFDAAPPQVNEYEMTTPDPSSVASGSREGSYESAEGEDEEEDESFQRSPGSREDSFDASLEDTDKTPVVLPEDWRFMSPSNANDELAAHEEDPFAAPRGSPAPNATAPVLTDMRFSPTRTDSLNSNGERRPLPPLPELMPPSFPRSRSDSNSSLQAAAERAAATQPQSAPSPPRPASLSKSELQGLGGISMSLEDRLRLMMIQEEEKNQAMKTANDEQRERRMRRANASPGRATDKNREIKIHEDVETEKDDDVAELGDFKLPPRINRESILRRVKTQAVQEDPYSSPAPESSPAEQRFSTPMDPDIPLPSLEDKPQPIVADDGTVIKPETEEQRTVDHYAIPGMYRDQVYGPNSGNSSFGSGVEQISSAPVIKQELEDDDQSYYSTDMAGNVQSQQPSTEETGGVPTPRAASPTTIAQAKADLDEKRMSLSQFASLLGSDDFASSFSHYMTPSPPSDEPTKTQSVAMPPPLQQALPNRPSTPLEQTRPLTATSGFDSLEEPGTPESVIRHKVSGDSLPEEPAMPEPVPEPVATVKAPGARLKTRPSLAPADIKTMAETRRKVSGEEPPVPSIPAKHLQRPSVIPEGDSPRPTSSSAGSNTDEEGRSSKRKSSLVALDIPVNAVDEGLSIGLDKEFDRVIEAQKVAFDSFFARSRGFSFSYDGLDHGQGQSETQNADLYKSQPLANVNLRRQKGYLMRQNTKMVVASSASHESAGDASGSGEPTAAATPRHRATRSAGNSPVKQGAAGAWTTEPWNGKARRRSIRQSAGSPMKTSALSGAVPPLPGMQSNVATAKSEALPEAEEAEEGKERGRLFVKVVGVKDLDLPLPRGERSYFCLTLDNGLHCVTTAWLELGRCAPIGQEFELVVLNDLEFQLTLQTKIEEPKAVPKTAPSSPTKAAKAQKSTFSRVFTSPKKRREQELKQQEEERAAANQKAADAEAQRKQGPTAWELLHHLVGKDGSFARSYVALKEHEGQAYGRPVTVDIPCFNEWTVEESRTLTSARSGRSGPPGLQKRAPYRIGKLELQLLYVPKPAEATDDDMPKSMNSCVRELQEAERTAQQVWEGHLSQQGGDCPYWRRRFFRLEGPKLTAYHEATRQPRATINLAKASKLIDDKSTLTQKEVSTKGGNRRKSAFAAEEEGYMFVEEGFRVRFANGEVIDFYADSAADKAGWMRALADVVGREARAANSWTGLVLARERQAAGRAQRQQMQQPQPQQQASRAQANAISTKSAPGTPATALKSSSSPRKPIADATGSPTKSSFSRPMSQQQYQGGHHGASRPAAPPQLQRPNSSDKPLPPRSRDSGAGLMSRHQKTRSMLF